MECTRAASAQVDELGRALPWTGIPIANGTVTIAFGFRSGRNVIAAICHCCARAGGSHGTGPNFAPAKWLE